MEDGRNGKTDYLKNHQMKARHVCTYLDDLSMLTPNMDVKFKSLYFFKFDEKLSFTFNTLM